MRTSIAAGTCNLLRPPDEAACQGLLIRLHDSAMAGKWHFNDRPD
jgi:hypothetical protein